MGPPMVSLTRGRLAILVMITVSNGHLIITKRNLQAEVLMGAALGPMEDPEREQTIALAEGLQFHDSVIGM